MYVYHYWYYKSIKSYSEFGQFACWPLGSQKFFGVAFIKVALAALASKPNVLIVYQQ